MKRLFHYLTETGVWKPPKPKRIKTPYDWLLNPYLEYLLEECQLSPKTILRIREQVVAFLEALGRSAARPRFKTLRAEAVERYLKQHRQDSTVNLESLGGSLRRFFRYCAVHQHTRRDFSGLIQPIRHYRHASLPQGMEDSAVERVLQAMDKQTPNGARDYAIMVLMSLWLARCLRGRIAYHMTNE